MCLARFRFFFFFRCIYFFLVVGQSVTVKKQNKWEPVCPIFCCCSSSNDLIRMLRQTPLLSAPPESRTAQPSLIHYEAVHVCLFSDLFSPNRLSVLLCLLADWSNWGEKTEALIMLKSRYAEINGVRQMEWSACCVTPSKRMAGKCRLTVLWHFNLACIVIFFNFVSAIYGCFKAGIPVLRVVSTSRATQ